jgi:hypothetical protein
VKKPLTIALFSLAALCACSQSPQEKAYNDALQTEGQYATTLSQAAPALIVQYQRVIDMDPKSEWAEKAQSRINLLQKVGSD